MQSNYPLVSIVIPCYNHGKYIDDSVNSVLKQTFRDFEIIIVNDGSTDANTNAILNNYNKSKTRVITIPNQGPSVAKNVGIREAKGQYILPLDADDKIEKTYIEKAVNVFKSDSEVGLVFSDFMFFGRFKAKARLNYKFPDYLIINNCTILTPSFFKKSDWEKVGGFNPSMRTGLEDYDFLVSLVESGVKVYHIKEILVYYRQDYNKSSRSNLKIEKVKDSYYSIYQNHENLFISNMKVFLNYIVDAKMDSGRQRKLIKYLKTFCIFSFVIILFNLLFYKFSLFITAIYLMLSMALVYKYKVS